VIRCEKLDMPKISRQGLWGILLSVLLIASPALLVSCGGRGPVRDYASLVAGLRAAGATVASAGSINQPFFSVEGKAITVNGENVQVFEYANEAAAKAEVATISPDGSTIGTSMVGWVGPPHFFNISRLIVLYVGNDNGVIGLLGKTIGPQVAGK